MSINYGMGLFLKCGVAVICTNLPPYIYVWTLKGYPSQSLGLVGLSNHEFLSQICTAVDVIIHIPIYSKVIRINYPNIHCVVILAVSYNRGGEEETTQDIFKDNILSSNP